MNNDIDMVKAIAFRKRIKYAGDIAEQLMLNGKRCTCSNPQTFTCQAKKEPVFYTFEYLELILKKAAEHGW